MSLAHKLKSGQESRIWAASYLGDALILLKEIPNNSIDLIFTSPPYALHFKKEYGNVDKQEYVAWFAEFAKEFHRVLKPEGSFF